MCGKDYSNGVSGVLPEYNGSGDKECFGLRVSEPFPEKNAVGMLGRWRKREEGILIQGS
jgi:hypothetical protein